MGQDHLPARSLSKVDDKEGIDLLIVCQYAGLVFILDEPSYLSKGVPV